MRSPSIFNIILFIFIFFSFSLLGKENWILDKNLSTIYFELPVLFANNVKGEFKEIKGLVEIDVETKKNNKAIFSVTLDSIDMNYKKYKGLLLGNIFFDTHKFPIALVDTKKFSYADQDQLDLEVELTIKGTSLLVPLKLEVHHLAEELIQIKGKLKFSRNSFQIGTGKWASTIILKDKAYIQANLFLFKE
jgi:polyisoprenoid-binding protein YceI